MAVLKRRFPNFVDVDSSERTQHQVSSMSDIRAIDWVKSSTDNPSFVRLSVSSSLNSHVLMAEFDNEYWGIGCLSDVEGLGLPIWSKS